MEPSRLDPRSGFSLPELLAALALMGILATLCYPAWMPLLSAGTRASGTALVMDVLEQGRREAIAGGRNVWVVMRQGSFGERDSMRIMAEGGGGTLPVGAWIRLPGGLRFRVDDGDLCGAKPPEVIARAAGADGGMKGAVMFRRSGTVGWPKEGEAVLSLRLENSGKESLISIARGTGRAALDIP